MTNLRKMRFVGEYHLSPKYHPDVFSHSQEYHTLQYTVALLPRWHKLLIYQRVPYLALNCATLSLLHAFSALWFDRLDGRHL